MVTNSFNVRCSFSPFINTLYVLAEYPVIQRDLWSELSTYSCLNLPFEIVDCGH